MLIRFEFIINLLSYQQSFQKNLQNPDKDLKTICTPTPVNMCISIPPDIFSKYIYIHTFFPPKMHYVVIL